MTTLRGVPTYAYCKVVYISKDRGLFNNKILLCKNCLKKRLSQVLPHFKNAVIVKGACRVCGDLWTDLSNKNCWFSKHKDYSTVKDRKQENGNEGNINILKAPSERPVNKEDMLSSCRIMLKFLNKAPKYAQCHFENKLWNKNEMLEYFRTCCFSKNVVFNAVDVFNSGKNIMDQIFGKSMQSLA